MHVRVWIYLCILIHIRVYEYVHALPAMYEDAICAPRSTHTHRQGPWGNWPNHCETSPWMSGPLEIGKQVKVNENLVLYHTFERETRSWIKQVPKRGPNQRIFKL